MMHRNPFTPPDNRPRKTLRWRLRQLVESCRERQQQPTPIRHERWSTLSVRALEPRLVLNATAELSMGQLLVAGTQAGQVDTIQLEVDANGDLLLSDANGQIEIENNPRGADQPLDPREITMNQVQFDLGDGDDSIDVQIPTGLDVTVDGGQGNDTAIVRYNGDTAPNQIEINAESIFIDPQSPRLQLSNDTVNLNGDLFLGVNSGSSQIDVGTGSVSISGRLVLQGNVTFVGNGGSVDLSDAVLTASVPDVRLSFDLGDQGNLTIGGADSSAGDFVDDVSVVSANRVTTTGDPLTISGQLSVRNVSESTELNSLVIAEEVIVATTSDISSSQSVQTNGGQILLSSTDDIHVAGTLSTASISRVGAINLNGQAVELSDAAITTFGGLINIRGPVELADQVTLDSGAGESSPNAGRVRFLDTVQGTRPGSTLRINALGSSLDGIVELRDQVTNLNGLEINGGRIDIDSISLLHGNASFNAIDVRLFGSFVETNGSGDILVSANLLLPTGDTRITAANDVRFVGDVKGQTGTGDLQVTAAGDAVFENAVTLIQDLNVDVMAMAQFDGPVAIAGDFTVDADEIHISADVTTNEANANGNIRLESRSLTSITDGAVLSTEQGTIQINGGGEGIDVGGGVLQSDNPDNAITIVDARQVTLGNVEVRSGRLTLGQQDNITARIEQANGTSIVVDELRISSTATIQLDNPQNEIRQIVDVTSAGAIAINDSSLDLAITTIDSRGNDVDITAVGSIFLSQASPPVASAILATGATTSLIAGDAIVDRNDRTNIKTSTLNLTAASIGSVSNPLDIIATFEVNAVTVDDGDASLANVNGPLFIGSINTGNGNVTLIAQSINDAQMDAQADLTANQLTMTATSGIGNDRPLELTSVSELVAVTDTGGVELELNATGATLVERLQANSGNILIRHQTEIGEQPIDLRLIDAGDGSITVNAMGTITARQVVSQNASGVDDTDGNGNQAHRDVNLTAGGQGSDILIESVSAANGADVILIAADDVLDTNPNDDQVIRADDLRITASNMVADQADAISLTTQVQDFVAAVTGPNLGNINISEFDSIQLANTDAADEQGQVTTSNGSITITANGSIEVVARQDGLIAMDAGGEGFISLLASGDSSDISVLGGLKTSGGEVNITADRNIAFGAAGDVASQGGNVLINADTANNQDGTIAMADGALIDAASGNIQLNASQQITLGGLRTTSDSASAISVTSANAAIVDRGDMHLDIDANAGTTTLTSVSGIGDDNALETNLNRLISTVRGSGATNINEVDAIVLENVTTDDGSIAIVANGQIKAFNVMSSSSPFAENMNADRDITLTANGLGSDILVGAINASNGSDVLLTAEDDILQGIASEAGLSEDEQIVTADDLILVANNGLNDGDDAIQLRTTVTDLVANVVGNTENRGLSNRGDLRISETDSINLANSDAQDDEIISTTNGQIVIDASATLTIFDNGGEDSIDLTSDPEVVARDSENGRIQLRASEIVLNDFVQLHSEKITTREILATRPMPEDLGINDQQRAVFIQAEQVEFGQSIEINTGETQGVARIFAPRPVDVDLFDPDSDRPIVPEPMEETFAFFDPFSVATNVLEQALINDAVGILTLDIGRAGEQGLTIDIDWGDITPRDSNGNAMEEPNARFQQINGIDADQNTFVGVDANGQPIAPVVNPQGAPVLQVEHLYTENDILNSTANGREAGTKPIEVRFAVRHHESILVLGNTVQQTPSGEEVTPGSDVSTFGIVSSTDNPITPRTDDSGLENGRAAFVIPALSIPVAFFPTREVIPEIETPEFIVRSESSIEISSSNVETSESTTASVASRDEFLQIRILSPDPEGEDLAPPQKLPDDILAGDKLQRLFENLPDGRYEIEYVLGDGNERSILRVDVRDGEATIPDEELDEGLLRLKRIQGEEIDEKSAATDETDEPSPIPNLPLPDAEASQEQSHQTQLSFLGAGVLATSRIRRLRKPPKKKRLSVASRFATRGSDRPPSDGA